MNRSLSWNEIARAPARAPSLQECADILAIQQLKARYAYFADGKYNKRRFRKPQPAVDRAARAQAACFTSDAVWEGGREFGAQIIGRSKLYRFFRGGPWRFAIHYYVAPLIIVYGETARGWWRLWQVGIPRGGEAGVFFAAVTVEEYRKEHGHWLHSAVRFEQTHIVKPSAGQMTLQEYLA